MGSKVSSRSESLSFSFPVEFLQPPEPPSNATPRTQCFLQGLEVDSSYQAKRSRGLGPHHGSSRTVPTPAFSPEHLNNLTSNILSENRLDYLSKEFATHLPRLLLFPFLGYVFLIPKCSLCFSHCPRDETSAKCELFLKLS